MADILNVLLNLQNQLRITHWQTKSHSIHVALGDLYEDISSKTDILIEVYQGINGRIKMTKGYKKIGIDNLDDKKIILFIKTCREKLKMLFKKNKINDTDLLSIRDEILTSINKTLYLLTLS